MKKDASEAVHPFLVCSDEYQLTGASPPMSPNNGNHTANGKGKGYAWLKLHLTQYLRGWLTYPLCGYENLYHIRRQMVQTLTSDVHLHPEELEACPHALSEPAKCGIHQWLAWQRK